MSVFKHKYAHIFKVKKTFQSEGYLRAIHTASIQKILLGGIYKQISRIPADDIDAAIHIVSHVYCDIVYHESLYIMVLVLEI